MAGWPVGAARKPATTAPAYGPAMVLALVDFTPTGTVSRVVEDVAPDRALLSITTTAVFDPRREYCAVAEEVTPGSNISGAVSDDNASSYIAAVIPPAAVPMKYRWLASVTQPV